MAETAGAGEPKTLTGSLDLQVDEAGLEALLVFTADPEGEQWTPADVTALLERGGVSEGVDERAIGVLFEAGGDRTVTAARGTPSQPGVPASFEPRRLPVPEDLAPYEGRVIPAGGKPRVAQRSLTKTKSETTVRKKPRLPFLRPKEEKQVLWEKSETVRFLEEPGEERGRGYAHKGDQVGTVTPGRKPRSGRSVHGREIPAEHPKADEGIYLGGPLRQSGGEIRAEEAGFYRYGTNWVELLPFVLHTHKVYASKDGLTCLLDFAPGSDSADPPTALEVLEEARGLGFSSDDLLAEDEVAELLSRALTDAASLKGSSLSRPVDAEASVDVAEDGLSARLTLRKGRGEGRQLDLAEVGDAIRRCKLKGMDGSRIKQAILEFHRGPDAVLEGYLLVEGREAEPGEDARIEWKAKFMDPERVEEIRRQSLARMDRLKALKSLGEFPLEAVDAVAEVKEREVVAVVRPATAGRPGVDVFGAVRPGSKGRDLPLRLFENLQSAGSQLVAQVQGILERGSREEETLLRVRAHRDREVQVALSEDGMQAFLSLLPAEGTGQPLELEEVREKVRAEGVTRGLVDGILEDALRRAGEGEKVDHLLIAQGQEAQDGEDTDLEILVQQASGQRVTLGSDGRADFRRQDQITTVQAGALLARLAAPSAGVDGWDVTGKVISGRRGAARYVHAGKNVDCRETGDGGYEYFARIDGELDHRGGAIDVQRVHTVEGEVGLGTGNVRFPGSVRIHGAVRSGFSVLSDESIFVEESVQGALLSAGESIRVEKGVLGEGKGVLRARKGIRAHFAEQATLLAVEGVHLTNACLRCTVKCNGRVVLESDKGNIIGGKVYCKLGLEAANLGSDREVRTEIHFGQDILVQDNLEREQRRMEGLRKRNAEIERSMLHAERTAPDDARGVEALRLEKRRNLQLIQLHSKRIFILQERSEQHFPSEIVVRGVIYPGVILESHGRQREIRAPLREVVFYFNTATGRIEEKALGE
jgi:uncharacterized protein (DUF342 family)